MRHSFAMTGVIEMEMEISIATLCNNKKLRDYR